MTHKLRAYALKKFESNGETMKQAYYMCPHMEATKVSHASRSEIFAHLYAVRINVVDSTIVDFRETE